MDRGGRTPGGGRKVPVHEGDSRKTSIGVGKRPELTAVGKVAPVGLVKTGRNS